MGHAVSVHRDDSDGRIADGLLIFENPDLSPLNKAAVVSVKAEVHEVLDKCRIHQILITNCARPGGHVQPRFQLQAVMFELDLSVFKGHVGAALHIRTAFARIIDGLSVHRDTHEIQSKRIDRMHLSGQRGDLNPFVVIADDQFIVDNFHLDTRCVGFDKTGVHHVVGLDIAAAVELRLALRQSHLLADSCHGATCARHG